MLASTLQSLLYHVPQSHVHKSRVVYGTRLHLGVDADRAGRDQTHGRLWTAIGQPTESVSAHECCLAVMKATGNINIQQSIAQLNRELTVDRNNATNDHT